MNATDLVELAGLVSSTAPGLIRGGQQLDPSGGETYWTGSKCRIDRWARALKLASGLTEEPHASHKAGPAGAGRKEPTGSADGVVWLCEEILMSEILARVWTAACAASDRRSGRRELELIARSVLVSHLECRRRVLGLVSTPGASAKLGAGAGAGEKAAKSLDNLRRVCERWADLLLAPFSSLCDLDLIAHDRRRVLDFAHDAADDAADGQSLSGQRHQLLSSSLRAAFQRPTPGANRNADLNAQIAAGVLASLGESAYEGVTICADWLWNARLSMSTSRVELLMTRLMENERLPGHHRPA